MTTAPVVAETSSKVVMSVDKWQIRDMELSPGKIDALWSMLQRYKTLFSDLTKDDANNFLNVLAAPHSLWFEVWEYDAIVGIIWFADMWQVTDCCGHMVFFDRAPAEKANLCREMVKWMFENFPIHRITVTPPVIYRATVRLLEKIGFSLEGSKYQSVLLGGRWVDQSIYGITRSEVSAHVNGDRPVVSVKSRHRVN
jgi:hypothetical protein